MARFTGSTWKKSRRLGISLSGTGKELAKRPYAPGQHGPNLRKKLSEYGLQLQEKQKLRYLHGMNEKQFRKLFDKAGKLQGLHGENFMALLATRLDSVVYSLGLARTNRQARQLVNHGHVLVDGKKVLNNDDLDEKIQNATVMLVADSALPLTNFRMPMDNKMFSNKFSTLHLQFSPSKQALTAIFILNPFFINYISLSLPSVRIIVK